MSVEKQAFEVLVHLDEVNVRRYLVYASSHVAAEQIALAETKRLLHANAVTTDPGVTGSSYDDTLN